jgi:hypothetical protein
MEAFWRIRHQHRLKHLEPVLADVNGSPEGCADGAFGLAQIAVAASINLLPPQGFIKLGAPGVTRLFSQVSTEAGIVFNAIFFRFCTSRYSADLDASLASTVACIASVVFVLTRERLPFACV